MDDISRGHSFGGHLFENVQRARKELRRLAHVYANTKDRTKRNVAGEVLEQAAIALALSASLWGMYADAARPAGSAGVEWLQKIDPERALERDTRVKTTTKRKKRV